MAIVGFVFPHTLQSLLEESFTDKIIQTYREDPDLQNFIDFGQQEVKITNKIINNNKNTCLTFVQVIQFRTCSEIFIKFYIVVQVLWFESRRILRLGEE